MFRKLVSCLASCIAKNKKSYAQETVTKFRGIRVWGPPVLCDLPSLLTDCRRRIITGFKNLGLGNEHTFVSSIDFNL